MRRVIRRERKRVRGVEGVEGEEEVRETTGSTGTQVWYHGKGGREREKTPVQVHLTNLVDTGYTLSIDTRHTTP